MIVSYLDSRSKATVSELTQVMNLSEGRVRAILLEMAKEGIIRKVGKTKSTHYELI